MITIQQYILDILDMIEYLKNVFVMGAYLSCPAGSHMVICKSSPRKLLNKQVSSTP